MSLNEAFGVVIFCICAIMFASWYSWCLWTMFVRCQRPSHFFNPRVYSTSELFVLVHVLALVVGAAYALHWATN